MALVMQPLDPPPEASYESLDEAKEAIQQWARPRGYAMTNAHSVKEHGNVKWVYMECDRRGKPVNKATKRPRAASIKCECKMKVLITHCLNDDDLQGR